MKKTSIPFLLAGITLVGALCAPHPALAAEDDPIYDVTENDQTVHYKEQLDFVTGNTSITMGARKDLSSLILTGYKNEDEYDQWVLTGSVKWHSANPDIVSVDGSGLATAHRVGTTKVTATGWDNSSRRVTQTIQVRVSAGDSAGGIQNSFSVLDGKKLDLNALAPAGSTAVKWSTTNGDVATVDKNGLVTARGVGSCTIKATCTDASGNSREMRTALKVQSIELVYKSLTATVNIKAGSSVDLAEILYPGYATYGNSLKDKYSIATGDSAVAGIDGLRVTAKKAGSCKVTFYESEGTDKKQAWKVTVSVYE